MTKPCTKTSGEAVDRNILLFKAPGSKVSFMDELVDVGWTPCVIEDPLEAGELARSRGISVGLILFDSRCGLSQWERIEDLLAGTGLKWVALVPDQCGEDAECWPLIENCFFDYHRLPIDFQRLSVILGHADGMARLRQRVSSQCCLNPSNKLMIGSSAVMRRVSRKLSRIARVDTPVLITGETGTGKELAARAIHDNSKRADGPFETVNCGALPPNLIQSELFGHEKGSFTGAYGRRIGRFEAADGGTIFLDEIGDLSPELQVILLRILEQDRLRRVGGTKDILLDVRVVVATHVDLERAVREGRFRQDLYYRLNVLWVYLPALRERENDVEDLAQYFLRESGERHKRGGLRFTQQARMAMRHHDWPGNVRELLNDVERAVVMSENNLITPADLELERRKSSRSPSSLEAVRNKAEKRAVISALYRTGHNITQAAQELGVSRVTIYRLIEKHEIDPKGFS